MSQKNEQNQSSELADMKAELAQLKTLLKVQSPQAVDAEYKLKCEKRIKWVSKEGIEKSTNGLEANIEAAKKLGWKAA